MKLSYVQCSNICCLKMQKKEDFYHTLIFRWAKNKKIQTLLSKYVID